MTKKGKNVRYFTEKSGKELDVVRIDFGVNNNS